MSQPGSSGDSSKGADVALTADSGATLLAVLSALPHGVIKTSHAVDGRDFIVVAVVLVAALNILCLHLCRASTILGPVLVLQTLAQGFT